MCVLNNTGSSSETLLPTRGFKEIIVEYSDQEGRAQEVSFKAIVIDKLGSPLSVGMDFAKRVGARICLEKNEIACQAPLSIELPTIFFHAIHMKLPRLLIRH